MKFSPTMLASLAVTVLLASSCASSDSESDALRPPPAGPDRVVDSNATRPAPGTDVEIAPAVDSISTLPAIPADFGDEVGSGAIGPAFEVRQPWPVGTIYTDLQPGAIVVDFVPPDRECIAAEVTATVGRGGVILVDLFVDAEREPGTQCAGRAIGNNVTVELPQTIIDRGFYTSTVPETGGESAAAEAVADGVIAMTVEDAEATIRDAGLTVRVLDGGPVEEDFDPMRINIELADGFVIFAAVG